MRARGLSATRFGIGIAAVAVLLAMAFWVFNPNRSEGAPRARSKPAAVPVLAPTGARPLMWGSKLSMRPQRLPRPAGQLRDADWLWPLGPRSSIAFVLHDGQSRWELDGRIRPLPGAPTDPIGAFAAAPGGSRIAYTRGTGVEVEGPDTETFIPNAEDPAFLPNGTPVAIRAEAGGFSVLSGNTLLRFPGSGTPFADPYLSPRDIAVDDRGSLGVVDWQSRGDRLVARVNPRQWPTPVAAGSLSGGSWFLLSRPTALPTYLLLVALHGRMFYHVWQSPTPPQAETVGGRLALTWLKPNGSLAVVQGSHLHPLGIVPGVFSVGTKGLVYQGGGGFLAVKPLP